MLARPPSRQDGFTRWIKRHRTGVAAAVVGSVLSVVSFGLLLSWEKRAERYQPPPLALDASGGYTNSLGMKFVPVPGTEVLFCAHETRRQDYSTYAGALPGISGA